MNFLELHGINVILYYIEVTYTYTFIENISPIITYGTGTNPRKAKMKNIIRIIDRSPNVVAFY
jgi:hypothetical protein